MTQEVFPEIKEAIEALEKRVTLTETEIAQMKEEMKMEKALLKSWRKALASVNPAPAKKKTAVIKGATA